MYVKIIQTFVQRKYHRSQALLVRLNSIRNKYDKRPYCQVQV